MHNDVDQLMIYDCLRASADRRPRAIEPARLIRPFVVGGRIVVQGDPVFGDHPEHAGCGSVRATARQEEALGSPGPIKLFSLYLATVALCGDCLICGLTDRGLRESVLREYL
jgi:hypothetical protein